MKIIDNFLCNISKNSVYINFIDSDSVFLDIETTGLKKESDSVYLIGLLFPNGLDNDDRPLLKLIFAESPDEEPLILSELLRLFEGKAYRLITFNGRRFDIPFLLKRYEIKGLTPPEALSSGNDLDIYKRIKDHRRSFGLSHMNQKSIEKMLGIDREDKYDGGELIKVYKNYAESRDDELLKLLLDHNRDDVNGMLEILPVLSYAEIFKDPGVIKEAYTESHKSYDDMLIQEFVIIFELPYEVPKPHLFHNLRLFLETKEKTGILRIPLYNGELKHFFENYRDYCYIPSEDKAVLKEIGKLMDPGMTEKAKAATCYVRASGSFLPLPPDFTLPDLTLYRQDHKSKNNYVLFTDDIIKNTALPDYLRRVLCEYF